MVGTVLLDTNVFTAWLKPRSSLVPCTASMSSGAESPSRLRQWPRPATALLSLVGGISVWTVWKGSSAAVAPLAPDDETAWEYARLRAACVGRSDIHCIRSSTWVIFGSRRRRSAGICLLLPTMPSSSAVRSSTYALNWRSQARDSLSRGEDRSSLIA